ncbi:hypothetical protein [Pontibacter litorisediminis]|nr:hypothetical protein [Pontibacter litorisediminis]
MTVKARKLVTVIAFAGFIVGLLVGAGIASKQATSGKAVVKLR